jgi:hypothetical protein
VLLRRRANTGGTVAWEETRAKGAVRKAAAKKKSRGRSAKKRTEG